MHQDHRGDHRGRAAALIAATCALLALPAGAQAATQAFAPVADARVEQAHPTANYGRSTTLRVDGGTDPAVETYVRFSVSALSGPIRSAHLRVYATSDSAAKPIASGTNGSWTERGLTWSNRPPRTAAITSPGGSVTHGTWVDLDVSPVVVSSGTYDFVLSTPSRDGLNMASRESSSPRPQLLLDVGAAAPASTTPPVVSGIAHVGQAMSVSVGSWSGATPMTYAYRWRRCDASGAACADVAGATGSAYTPTSADAGSTLRAVVTATNSAGSASATSAATAQVSAAVQGGAVGVPMSGVWLGAWTSPNTGLTVDEREAQIGRRYAIVHRYHGWNEAFPDAQEQQWAAGGRMLYLSWDARDFKTGAATSWAGIAAGEQDAVIDAQADRVRALGRPLLMDFSQEPESEVDDGRYGTVADYAAAYRHIVQRFRARGAGNVAWVWSVMGYSGYYGYYTGGLYPGDDVVDWIGWDPYNWYLCHNSAWKSFAEKVSGFYSWLLANGHADKPFMLSEFGSAENDLDPSAKGQWFRDAAASLKAGSFPNLRALVYFDSNKTGECDWRVDSSTASLDGWREIAQDPFLNP